ncbi:YtfJ family protein [Corallincola spongiicola]|uniref:YtfJ family protein n=1 Tax=Corallincola spongiicola TaxID=2520508 RepID=A0ABY1WSG9_9GAMM|nr:YtfJ family protein [Corallincola spongiicola]TAA47683.1 YtfJ family protein [Corallincola spongiicola]
MATKTDLRLLIFIIVYGFFTCFTVSAHNLSVGGTAPTVAVDKLGEIVLTKEEISYQPWDTSKLAGKVRVIQAMAGRTSAKQMNAPLMTMISEQHFPEQSYQTTTIINQDDAMWGTSGIVKSSAESSKKEFPWSSLVVDQEGDIAKAWGLKEESSAIIVQNQMGEILFVKEGKLSDKEMQQVIELINKTIQ